MAIKGKRRPRGHRVVAAPPRPQLMVRKKPFWQRRWFWVALGVVALAAIVLGVLLNMRSNNKKEQEARQLAAAQNYAAAVQSVLPDDRTAVAPDLIIPFPTFQQTIDDLSSGSSKPAKATADAKAVQDAATTTAEGLNKIDTTKVIPTEFRDLRAASNNSKTLFVQSFRLYADAASLTRQAATMEGDQRKALLVTAGDVFSRASLLFQSGLRMMSGQITRHGGTFQIVQPPQPTPTPTPTPTATPSASATPTATETAPAPTPTSST
jgi:cell division septation protein DedD